MPLTFSVIRSLLGNLLMKRNEWSIETKITWLTKIENQQVSFTVISIHP
ncbi:hypothetical protein SAMN05216327_1029 [Dyadobacter sp. SG02]|nr:hypothetical protein SAMN05216327_1029 [Dyadobacter sp. SG02]